MKKTHLFKSDLKLQHLGYGEWIEEPDLVEFESHGFKCICERKFEIGYGGYWCGYVFITSNHPWFEKEYAHISADIHGELTYSQLDNGSWKVGFDCAHCYDIVPSMEPIRKDIDKSIKESLPNIDISPVIFERTYKNMDFVIKETEELARQAKEAVNCPQLEKIDERL